MDASKTARQSFAGQELGTSGVPAKIGAPFPSILFRRDAKEVEGSCPGLRDIAHVRRSNAVVEDAVLGSHRTILSPHVVSEAIDDPASRSPLPMSSRSSGSLS